MQQIEFDTKQEIAAPNGHDAAWKTFDDDQAFLQHILSKKPAEKLVDVEEWETQILCRALPAEARIYVQAASTDEETRRYDYRQVFHLIVMYGCYNPTTGRLAFTTIRDGENDVKKRQREAQVRVWLMQQLDGAVIEQLAMTVLRLSRMLVDDTERAKKN